MRDRMLRAIRWEQVTPLSGVLWDAYDHNGDKIGTIRMAEGRLWASLDSNGIVEAEDFRNVGFAKLWMEKQYAKQ